MRILVLVLLAACSVDESLSVTTQDLSKEQIEGSGGICYSTGYNKWGCVRCEGIEVIDEKGQSKWYHLCTTYACEAVPPGVTECVETGYWVGGNTLVRDLNYWYEAESGTRSGTVGAMQVTSSATASNGASLDLAGGGGTTRFDDLYIHYVPADLTPWVRVIAPSTSANAFYLQVDNVSRRYEVPVSTTWSWVRLDATYSLAHGHHPIRIHSDEPGLRIDRILFTANPGFVPVVHTVQAEAYGWVPPMTSATTKTFPPTTYIWVPNGAGPGGFAQLETHVPRADSYVVWGRFQAPSESDNAIYIAPYLEDRVEWHVPTTSSLAWRWDRADDLVLQLDGSSIIEIARLEDGTKLDRLVFTNDPGFTLVE